MQTYPPPLPPLAVSNVPRLRDVVSAFSVLASGHQRALHLALSRPHPLARPLQASGGTPGAPRESDHVDDCCRGAEWPDAYLTARGFHGLCPPDARSDHARSGTPGHRATPAGAVAGTAWAGGVRAV